MEFLSNLDSSCLSTARAESKQSVLQCLTLSRPALSVNEDLQAYP